MDWLAALLHGKGEVALAGLAGATVSAVMEWTGFLPALRRLLVGTLCAMWLSPLAIPLVSWLLSGLRIPQENAIGMSGFLMGVLGIIFIEFLLTVFRVRLTKEKGDDPKSE